LVEREGISKEGERLTITGRLSIQDSGTDDRKSGNVEIEAGVLV
jgi:hypothetical protein